MNNQSVTSITGRLGKSPVLYHRDTKKGRFPVAKFSLAVETFSNGKAETMWFQCSAWDKRADTIMRNLRKGDPVQLHGFASVEKFTGKDGNEVVYPHFNVIYTTFLKPRNKTEEQPPQEVAAQAGPVDDNEVAF